MERSQSDKPTYALGELKRLIKNDQTRYITRQSILDAAEIDYSVTEIVDAVLSLQGRDFSHTMPSEEMPPLWQDVYKPTRKGIKLYVKLQKSVDGKGVVISFKKA